MNGRKKVKLLALDSNIFIYNLEDNPQFVKFTDLIFEKLISNKKEAVTSIISLTEILSYPKSARVEHKLIEDFFTTPNLEVLEVTREIAIEAAKIRREQRFRLPDSIQLATAIHAKADVFITNDQRLQKFKEIDIALLSTLSI